MDDVEKKIKSIYDMLDEGCWGTIDPYWFKYLDLTKKNKDCDEDHVAFQKLLQSALSK